MNPASPAAPNAIHVMNISLAVEPPEAACFAGCAAAAVVEAAAADAEVAAAEVEAAAAEVEVAAAVGEARLRGAPTPWM